MRSIRVWIWHRFRRVLRSAAVCAPLIVAGCEAPPDSFDSAAAPTDRREPAPITLSATIVQPDPIPQQRATLRADRRWETTAPMPEALVEPAREFVNYLLNDVGDEFQAHVQAGGSETSAISTAEANRSHLRNLRDLYYVWKQFHDGCGPLQRMGSLEYKSSYAGDFVEARCVGQRGERLIRLVFDEGDGRINGCLLNELPDAPTYPPTVYARTSAQCGRHGFDFVQRICGLALDVRVVEDRASPRRIDCGFDVWLRAHPFYFGAVGAQPHLLDRSGYIWRRVNPDTHLVDVNHDLNRYRIRGLQAGTYRVAARVRGCPGALISAEVFLDGSQPETAVVIPLRWARSVEVVVPDPPAGRPLGGDDLQLFLGGWSWRAWRVHPRDRTMAYWGSSRYKMDRLRFQNGRFSLGKIPAGEYVLGFNPPVECRMFAASEPPREIVVKVQAGTHNRFVLTTDTIRRFANWNFDMFVDANHADLKSGYHVEDLIQPSTVALLGFCDRREAQDVLYHLMRSSTPAPLRLAAARALLRHDDFQGRILPRAAHLLALVNAGEQPAQFAAPCAEILRRADGGNTENSARAARVEMPDDIRRLALDLGSEFPPLRVYAARQLASAGKRASAAVPFLTDALADDRFEWEPDNEQLISFERVSDAARQALRAIEDSSRSPG